MFKLNKSQTILLISLVCLISIISLSRCGDSSTATTTTTTTSTTTASSSSASTSFPSNFAVASPTASTSSNASINALVSGDVLYAGISSGSSFVNKTAIYRTILAAADAAACQVTLPTLTPSTDPSCYGPALDYCEHPDFTGTTDVDCTDADASNVPNDTDGDDQLPTGDLGIWTSTQGGTESCSAAKVNQLMQDTGDSADYIMLMTASMACLAIRNGSTWPTTDGASLTLTTELNTAIQVNNPSVTVSSATVTNLTDITDSGTTNDALKFSVVVTDSSGGSAIDITGNMNHMRVSGTATSFKGRIWAEIGGTGGAGDKSAFTLTYHRESATSLKYKLLAADYQLASSTTVIHDATGDLLITGGWTGNMSQAIINLDPSTGLGDFSYSWQAGTGDDSARIFNGYTTATDGCAFFGYGGRFDNTAGTASDNVIDGFICNWAGPGNDHSMSTTSGLGQKQCMTIGSSSGLFEVNTAKENITYAPTTTCNSTATLGLKATTDTTYTYSAITNNLVTLSTDTDFTSYTAPTAPTIPTGL
ncbi:hypothetical protein BVY03_05130 [bacterium K02(2017)]|nr:hypothetical protein BVY03_05130 [bacterium K02(2017)]